MFFSLFEKYLLKKLLLSFLLVSILTLAVVWLVRAIQEVDIVLSQGSSIFNYLQITLLGVAPLAVIVLPIALTISALYVIANLNEGSELTVATAAGFSRVSLLKPFLFVAFLASFIIYILSLYLSPLSLSSMRLAISNMRADIITTILQTGQFTQIGKGLTFHIASRGQGGKLHGLFIRDSRNENEIIYISDEANFSKVNGNNFLILQSGQIHTRQQANYSLLNFDSYIYDLSTLSSASSAAKGTHREISTYSLFTLPESLLPSGSPKGHFRAELHNRLTVGLYPFAFIIWVVAILGYPRSQRQQQRRVRICVLILLVIIRCLGIVSLEQARYTSSGYLLLWLVPLGSMALAFFLMRYPIFFANLARLKAS